MNEWMTYFSMQQFNTLNGSKVAHSIKSLFYWLLLFDHLTNLIGWEPTKNRNSTLYVRPFENTIKLDPLTCQRQFRDRIELVILQHSAPKNFDTRMANRFTWMKYASRYKFLFEFNTILYLRLLMIECKV